jgi:2-isopropylmalate synthase
MPFAHESGIHQDGVLKHRETYEIMRAEDVGWNTNKLVAGQAVRPQRVQGRAWRSSASSSRATRCSTSAFAKFKELADKKGEVFDEDLHALMSDEVVTPDDEHYKLLSSMFHSETGESPQAKLTLSAGVTECRAESSGSGPVDATFKAIESVAASGSELLLYSVNAITTGTDAQGEVTVRLAKDGRIVNGQGADTDIVVASAKAYINALNKLRHGAEKLNPQL